MPQSLHRCLTRDIAARTDVATPGWRRYPDHLPVDGAYLAAGHESLPQTNGGGFGKGGQTDIAGRLEFLGTNLALYWDCLIQFP